LTFIASVYDKFKDKIHVWEKNDGKRVFKEHPGNHYFYAPDQLGDYTAVTGEKLKKVQFSSRADMESGIHSYPLRFESDLNPLERCMMDVYASKPVPKLVYSFIDIEVDYDPSIGWPRPSNPYAPINSLTLYKTDASYVTWAVPPVGWLAMGAKFTDEMLAENYIICKDERDLLEQYFKYLESADLVSGWNSEFFDMPYLGKRVEMLFGQPGLRKLEFDRAPLPRWGEAERFKGGSKEIILQMQSRVHLDYMRLFKKFNLEGRQSHALAAIADDELDIPKLHYNGSLYQLYRGLWRPNLAALKPAEEWDELYTAQVEREMIYQEIQTRMAQAQGGLGEVADADLHSAYEALDNRVKELSFITFVIYNRRDVEIIVQLDDTFKYLDLANAMVHMATVNFGAVFGSVQLIDTAILNYCHTELHQICFDRQHKPKQEVEGALVMTPKIGLHKKIASVDIRSLYPSTYRLLNLSPEKIVGQLLGYEDDWKIIKAAHQNPDNDLLQNKKVILRLEGQGVDDDLNITARELIDLLKARKFALSAYGTILDQGNGMGLLPAVLTYWFNGRIDLQAKKKEYAKKAEQILKANNGNEEDPEYVEANKLSEYYDMLQGVRKVLLNSSYGATLNEFCRMHDPRLGASTTGSGRQITTHMIETIATAVIGDNAPKLKKTVQYNKKGEIENLYTMDCPARLGPIYSDTDSCYFLVDALAETIEDAIACADAVADTINESFNGFCENAFFVQPEFNGVIKANREMVAHSGIFRAKKKYIMYVADMEGKRIDPDSPKALKTQGSDIKLSSTPEMIRGMLKDVTMMILKGEDKRKVETYVIEFRRNLNNIENNDLNILEFASVTSVKTYDDYFSKWERIEKPGLGKVPHLPAAVRASIHHNELVKELKLGEWRPIMGGDKVKMLWLKPNDRGWMNFAFNSDIEELPKWFVDRFNVDIKITEQKLIDQKLGNIFEPISWEVPTLQSVLRNKLVEF